MLSQYCLDHQVLLLYPARIIKHDNLGALKCYERIMTSTLILILEKSRQSVKTRAVGTYTPPAPDKSYLLHPNRDKFLNPFDSSLH